MAASIMVAETLALVSLWAAQAADVASTNKPALEDVPKTPEEAKHTVLSSLGRLWAGFLEQSPLFLAGLLVLLVTWGTAGLIQKLVDRALVRVKLRLALRELIARLAAVAVWLIGLLVAMTVMFPSITPAKALATLGLGSIAIGFAFKDIFENFFAGVLILWRFPFGPGDYIECEGIVGQVEDVTIRNTLIRKTTGELVVMPNATVYKSPVQVLTNLPRRRVTIICGVAYGEDLGEARSVISHAVQECGTVYKDQPVQVFAQEFGESSVNFEVAWWTGPRPVDIRRSRDEVVESIKRALDGAGIEIPFPYRTLTFKGPLETALARDRWDELGDDNNRPRPGEQRASSPVRPAENTESR